MQSIILRRNFLYATSLSLEKDWSLSDPQGSSISQCSMNPKKKASANRGKLPSLLLANLKIESHWVRNYERGGKKLKKGNITDTHTRKIPTVCRRTDDRQLFACTVDSSRCITGHAVSLLSRTQFQTQHS